MKINFKAVTVMLLCAFSLFSKADEEPLEAPAPEKGESSLGLRLLPGGRLFRLTFADPREIRMAFLIEGGSHMDAYIGNYFSLFSLEPLEGGWKTQFGLEGGGFFSMRAEDSRLPLEHVDGLIGMFWEGASGPYSGQIRYTHISSHLADGSTGRTAFPYSREFFSVRAGYTTSPEWFVYGGFQYLASTIPDVPPWALQAGAMYFWIPPRSRLSPFIAGDFKYKQESTSNPCISIQLGLALNNPPEAYRSFRFFYAYQRGADPRGQYYLESREIHSLGVEMQI